MGNEHCSLRGSPGVAAVPESCCLGRSGGCRLPRATGTATLPSPQGLDFILFAVSAAGGFSGSAPAASTCGLLGDNTQGHTDPAASIKVVCVPPTPYRGALRPRTAPVGPRGGTGKTLREPRVPACTLTPATRKPPGLNPRGGGTRGWFWGSESRAQLPGEPGGSCSLGGEPELGGGTGRKTKKKKTQSS